MRVDFYQLSRDPVEWVVPLIARATRAAGERLLVVSGDGDALERIDHALWDRLPEAVLAHGRADQPHAERQPVLLSESGENLNGAQALFILDGAELGQTEAFERCFILFDGRDETALNGARARWKALKAANADLAYWRQDADGRWERAA